VVAFGSGARRFEPPHPLHGLLLLVNFELEEGVGLFRIYE